MELTGRQDRSVWPVDDPSYSNRRHLVSIKGAWEGTAVIEPLGLVPSIRSCPSVTCPQPLQAVGFHSGEPFTISRVDQGLSSSPALARPHPLRVGRLFLTLETTHSFEPVPLVGIAD